MDTDQHTYRSFLLRLWRSKSDATTSWYASLEDPVSGERKGFSSLTAMVDFLESNLTVTNNSSTNHSEERK